MEEQIHKDEQNLHDCIVLTAQEFMVLAAGIGMERVRGIFRQEDPPLTADSMAQCLVSLTGSGILKAATDEESSYLQAEPATAEIFHAIQDSKRFLLIYQDRDMTPAMSVYMGSVCAVSQVSGTDDNSVRLFSMKPDDLAAWLAEESYCPSEEAAMTMLRYGIEEEASPEEFPAFAANGPVLSSDLLKDPRVRTVYQYGSCTGSTDEEDFYLVWADAGEGGGLMRPVRSPEERLDEVKL